ncbi:hypothetical protein RhiJN_16422 [Ceratobasidium sp. AG-Ba]|nr:hypothetical protein RhiJN_16422 [Ceratobasidium sp. AG-Ba]
MSSRRFFQKGKPALRHTKPRDPRHYTVQSRDTPGIAQYDPVVSSSAGSRKRPRLEEDEPLILNEELRVQPTTHEELSSVPVTARAYNNAQGRDTSQAPEIELLVDDGYEHFVEQELPARGKGQNEMLSTWFLLLSNIYLDESYQYYSPPSASCPCCQSTQPAVFLCDDCFSGSRMDWDNLDSHVPEGRWAQSGTR